MVDSMERGRGITTGGCSSSGAELRSLSAASVPFAKMQALGNDFVFLSEKDLGASTAGALLLENWSERSGLLARRLCDRHFGVGADGLILVRPSDNPDCQIGWSYVNADGSPSLMCGNGLRCLALFAVENQLVSKNEFWVWTGSQKIAVSLESAQSITTDLGMPEFCSESIPVAGPPRAQVLKETLTIGGINFKITCLSMGNPHCVIFNSGLKESDFRVLAPRIQELPFFPEGVNVEFVEVVDRDRARVLVWERGCGPTLACASGAAATLVAGVMEGRLERRAEIGLPGGCLTVAWSEDDGHVRITGPAANSYKGVVDLTAFLREGSV